ncbi:hypothetical protein [Chamaesiphon sp. VAR_48_metabat_135_sub]|uniref:hypothetical protein n=1 Tax=Chamaesiphon sp. VAR_48_metabat_135_sub TaxID=2964699 RepID=UPI00286AEC9C|nr:hypothetical protein [Chamaesiphon sp. VAR_48_metabat_135_sub]
MKLISNLISRVKFQPPVRLSSNKKALLSSLLLFGIFLSTTDRAFARDVCKDVKITLVNKASDTIKITKFEYKDIDKNKFRTELILGINGREFLNPRKSFTDTRNLEFVGNDETLFRVTYEKKIGGTKFEPPITKTTPKFTCRNGSSHTVELD